MRDEKAQIKHIVRAKKQPLGFTKSYFRQFKVSQNR